jgi:hypothetical protein
LTLRFNSSDSYISTQGAVKLNAKAQQRSLLPDDDAFDPLQLLDGIQDRQKISQAVGVSIPGLFDGAWPEMRDDVPDRSRNSRCLRSW